MSQLISQQSAHVKHEVASWKLDHKQNESQQQYVSFISETQG